MTWPRRDWQHENSLFSVYANGCGGNTQCTHDAETQPLAQVDLSPWDASAYDDYSWVEQRNHNSLLLEVSMTCLFNSIVSECFDLQNVVDVFVLLRSYKATTPEPSVSCNSFICSVTTDKTLLGLHKVHQRIGRSTRC